MSPLRSEILATLLEILSDLPPPLPRTKILATPLIGIIVSRGYTLQYFVSPYMSICCTSVLVHYFIITVVHFMIDLTTVSSFVQTVTKSISKHKDFQN